MSLPGRPHRRSFASASTALLTLALASAGGLLGCGGAACPGGVVDVPTRPPAPLPEEPQTPPTPGMIWIAGYWHYGPSPEPIWVWVPGHWTTAPEGQRWVPARTSDGEKSVRYHPGGFCR